MKQPVKHSVKRRNLDDSGGRGAGVSAVFAKDTLRCWLRSWKRFVSIAVITLLGVAVLTGIYGMNFDYMPELHWHYGYFMVLGLMALIIISLLLLFNRRKWL